MHHEERLREILLSSAERRACLAALAALPRCDAWLSAGFVRNAVFDALYGDSAVVGAPDLDVIYHDLSDASPARDRALERALCDLHPAPWEVKNQVRMAARNGHGAYRDVAHALAHFPETATAVAVRIRGERLEVLAPYGLDDLFAGVMRRSPLADAAPYRERCRDKRWRERWPGIRVIE